jgi:DegV family protein with EDD domain
MRIIADSGADISPSVLPTLDNLSTIPLIINLGDETLRSGIDVTSAEFYDKLLSSDHMPTTSQPSPGDFTTAFEREASHDKDLLVITISSGLSGTHNAAQTAIENRNSPTRVALYDSLQLSIAYGWMVQAACRMAAAGATAQEIGTALDPLRECVLSIFTLEEMRYLVHGGRVSHIRGLLASTLNIKPIIAVNNQTGRYDQLGRARTVKRAYQTIIEQTQQRFGTDDPLRVQIVHGNNPPGAELLAQMLREAFKTVNFMPTAHVSPVLGAHTGPTLVGMAAAPESVLAALPVAVE